MPKVIKDSEALYILVPNFRIIIDDETGVEKEF